LLVNLLTASRSPTVWCDEVMFADPAANLHFGHGFTSTAWSELSRSATWFSNGSPYVALVYPWIQTFGFSPAAVRSLNYVLVIGAVLLLWVAVRRWRLIASPWMRLLLVSLVLCDYVVTFSYRSSRYDILGFALIAAIFAAATILRVWVRWIAVVALSACVPVTGIQLLPYVGILMGLFLLFFGRRVLTQFVPIGIGLLVGLTGLYAVSKTLGLWGAYLLHFNATSSGELVNHASPSWTSLLQIAASRLSHPHGENYLGDYSADLIVGCLVLMGFWLLWKRRFRFRSAIGFGVATAVSIPLVMGGLLDRYTTAYMWMGAVPLGVCVVMAAEKICREYAPINLRLVCGGLLLAACCVGLPLRLLVIGMEWRQRDYAQVETFVTQTISSNDWVYCDFPAYYPAKTTAAMVFLPTYQLSKEDKAKINVLVIDPDDRTSVVKNIGGNWAATGAALDSGAAPNRKTSCFRIRGSAKLYRLAVLRRTP
jgi:hypothetical protein